MRVSRIELTVKFFGHECTRSVELPSHPELTPDDVAFLRHQISSDVERLMKEDIEKHVLGV